MHHELSVACNDGGRAAFALEPQSVATFYRRLMDAMDALDLHVQIHKRPNEIADAIPFDQDETHRAYDREYANRFWRVLVQADRVLKAFRAGFLGKCSPVHLFWGGLDLAVTRFSGRPAPPHPGGIPTCPTGSRARPTRTKSAAAASGPAAVRFPTPPSMPTPIRSRPVSRRPRSSRSGAFYSTDLREFILPYDVVRESAAPDDTLRAFLPVNLRGRSQSGKMGSRALERLAIRAPDEDFGRRSGLQRGAGPCRVAAQHPRGDGAVRRGRLDLGAHRLRQQLHRPHRRDRAGGGRGRRVRTRESDFTRPQRRRGARDRRLAAVC